MTHLTLTRIALNDYYTIGHLYIDGKYFCDTLEPPFNATEHPCIPKGSYKVISYPSSRFHGIRPLLLNVPNREGILIHEGNTAKNTQGCILVGLNTRKGGVYFSRDTLTKLMSRLQESWQSKEEVDIVIN